VRRCPGRVVTLIAPWATGWRIIEEMGERFLTLLPQAAPDHGPAGGVAEGPGDDVDGVAAAGPGLRLP
jgi:hypothetical protein